MNQSNPDERIRIAIESVNEAGGLLHDRIGRLISFFEKHTGKETEGLRKSLNMMDDELLTRLPKIIRKAREKTDSGRDLAEGILREEAIE